jgi:hypothetical protein
MLPKTRRKIDSSHLEKCEEEEEEEEEELFVGWENADKRLDIGGVVLLTTNLSCLQIQGIQIEIEMSAMALQYICCLPNCCPSLSFDLKSYIFLASNHIDIRS